MRLLVVLAFAVLVAPGATAREPTPADDLVVAYDIEGPSDDCPDCVAASASVYQQEPENCADCAAWGAHVGASHDEQGIHADATVCRSGFVVICVVDEHRTIPV